MTTAAMVLGVIPLVTATGAGAVSRFQMGVVIASGLSIGTLFTLFVVPAVYLVFAADHHLTAAAADDAVAPEPHTPVPDAKYLFALRLVHAKDAAAHFCLCAISTRWSWHARISRRIK